MGYVTTYEPRRERSAKRSPRWTVDDLKPLAALVDGAATRKGDLVDLLTKVLEDPEKVRSLYEGLGDVAQKSVQEATHSSEGVLDHFSVPGEVRRTVPRFWRQWQPLSRLEETNCTPIASFPSYRSFLPTRSKVNPPRTSFRSRKHSLCRPTMFSLPRCRQHRQSAAGRHREKGTMKRPK